MKKSAQIEIFPRLSFLDRLMFTKHLAVMLKAGIILSEALSTLEEQSKSNFVKKIILKIHADIDNGQLLSKALLKYPKFFDAFYINLVKIGEESGNLEKNLEFLALKLDKDYQTRNKIQGVMLYPAIVLTMGAIIGFSLSIFVLPKMADLFKSMDIVLPLPTRILMFISGIIQKYNILIVAVVALLVMLFSFFIKLKSIKPYWHKFLLSLPIFGPFIQNVQISTFCRNLGIMLKSGLPITTALEVSVNSTENLVYKKYAENLLEAVTKGKSFGSELNMDNYPLMTHLVSKMLAVGEKSGKLDEMLLYLGDFFEAEADNTAKNFSTILEPVLLIVIGLLVAFIALAIIGPIYQFTGSIGR